jgi:hypothetical protein
MYNQQNYNESLLNLIKKNTDLEREKKDQQDKINV